MPQSVCVPISTHTKWKNPKEPAQKQINPTWQRSSKQNETMARITKYIAAGMVPFSEVEESGFRNLFDTKYELPIQIWFAEKSTLTELYISMIEKSGPTANKLEMTYLSSTLRKALLNFVNIQFSNTMLYL